VMMTALASVLLVTSWLALQQKAAPVAQARLG